MERRVEAQRVALTVDFSGRRIQGRTRLRVTVDEQTAAAGHISLFCKQLTVTRVSLAGADLNFSVPPHEAWAHMVAELLEGSAEYDKMMQVHFALWELENSQKGLMKIFLPPERRYKDVVLVDIEYLITEPVAGLVFYHCNGRDFLISDGLFETVRCWTPCDDSLGSSYSFGLEISVPSQYTAIASGRLLEIAAASEGRKSYRFLCEEHTLVGTIGVCVGEFGVVISDPNISGASHFCVDRREDLEFTIRNSLFTYSNMIAYLNETIGDRQPFSTHCIAFLPNLPKTLAFTSLALISDVHLLSSRVLEGRMESLQELASATVFNWFGAYFSHQETEDVWLIVALRAYLANTYCKHCGCEELPYYICKEVEKYCHMVETGQEFRPLCSKFFSHPNELLSDAVFMMKAPLILHMIESTIGKGELLEVIKKISGQSRRLSTPEFIKSLKPTGINLSEFSRYWIYGTGAPYMECSFEYKPKVHAVELTLTQRPLAWQHLKSKANSQFPETAENDFQVPMRMNLMRVYKGPLKVIIHETDKIEKDSAEHIIVVEGEKFTTMIPCKKPIKKTTSTKRRDDSDRMKLYQNQTLESPVLWIRVDPDFEVLRRVKVVQSRAMWYQQLEGERQDPIGQIDAMIMLSHDVKNVSLKTFTSLYDIVKNTDKHYLVRTQACRMMAALSDTSNGFKGLDLLVFYYLETHFDKGRTQALPNNFASRSSYLVDKAVLEAITSVKDMSLSHCFKRLRVNSNFVTEFVRDLLRNNDNSANGFDDAHWRGWLLEMLCSCNNPVYVDEVLDELLRQMRLDAALKSRNLVILQHAVQGYVKLVETFCLWGSPKAQEIWCFLEQQLADSPYHLQACILRAMVRLLTRQHRSPNPAFRLVLSTLVTHPPVLCSFTSVLQSLAETLMTDDSLVTIAKESSTLRTALWGMISSPYASLQHYYRYSLATLYRQIYGYDWSTALKDSAWRAQLDQTLPMMSNTEGGFARHQPVVVEEGSIEPVDLSTGDWKSWAMVLVERMMNHDYAEPFCEPVDHVRLGLKDYLDLVKRPMDFSTIKGKLAREEYADFLAFSSDVYLVFDNCRIYNMEGSLIYSWAETLDYFFTHLSKPIKEKIGLVREEVTKVVLRLDGSETHDS